jgi:hypothetical protein
MNIGNDSRLADLTPPLLLVAGLIVAATIVARRRGYGVGGRTAVRCRDGHLFTTIWIPGGSLKAIRLGWVRFQWCPVGEHWTLVVPVREADLSPGERREAARHHDLQVP